jgi:hypothetical protein
MIEPVRLIYAGVCCSFSEARRMIANIPEKELLRVIQEKENWGRKPRRISIATHKKENRKFIDHFV